MHTLAQSTQTVRVGPSCSATNTLDRFVGLFADIRAGEGARALLLFADVGLVLAACYCVKPARDAWLAASAAGLEWRAWGTAVQAAVFIVLVPAYAALAQRVPRHRLLAVVHLSGAASLLVFWYLQSKALESAYFGLAFYVWAGTFTAVIVSQFWSFAADIYTDEAGRRLFPFIALGASAGAVAASSVVAALTSSGRWDTATLLLLAALLLVAAALVTPHADVSTRRVVLSSDDSATPGTPFGMVLRCRYLMVTMGLMVVLNWASANGENLLFGVVQESIRGELASYPTLAEASLRQVIADRTSAFYGGFFFWTNLLTLVLQVVITSRLPRSGGCAFGLMLLPLMALASYSLMALMPALGIVKMMRVAERATAYSVQSTTGQLLWLRAPAPMKYEAKLLIDTIGVRLGDGLSAATLLLGIGWLGLSLHSLLAVNLVLVAVWLCLGAMVSAEHGRLAKAAAAH